MLPISVFRAEPPITCCASGALHHLNEVLSNLGLLIAASSVCHQPILRWTFNVRGVHFSHLLHSESVDIEVKLVIRFHLNHANFSVKVLARGGWISRFARLHSSPQHALANFRTDFCRDVAELLEVFGNPLFSQLGGCCNRCWNVVDFTTGIAPTGSRTTGNLQSGGKVGSK